MAKTFEDKAVDAMVKHFGDRNVNWYLVAAKLKNQPHWIRDAIWDFIESWVKVWEIESRYPSVSRDESDAAFAAKMAKIKNHL
jgi:hypothetical protein